MYNFLGSAMCDVRKVLCFAPIVHDFVMFSAVFVVVGVVGPHGVVCAWWGGGGAMRIIAIALAPLYLHLLCGMGTFSFVYGHARSRSLLPRGTGFWMSRTRARGETKAGLI